VHMDVDEIRAKGYEVIEGNLLQADGQVRHDPDVLASLIFEHYFKVTKALQV